MGITRTPSARADACLRWRRHGIADRRSDTQCRPERRTFFVWEAVNQYPTEAGIRKTFNFPAAPGSRLVFTYAQGLLGRNRPFTVRMRLPGIVLKRQLWHFGMDPTRLSLTGLAG